MQTKECSKCGEVKALNRFHKSKTGYLGVRADCIVCRNKRKKKYYADKKERIKQQQRKYREENKERIKQQQRKYREENKERIKQQEKKYREENKERIKKYYAEKKERIKQQQRKYREENKERIRQQRRKRYHNDPIYKLRVALGKSIRNYLKNGKSKRTAEILGCSYEQFYLNLGPRAENAHLDHIVPQSLAQKDEEVYLLNHWSNFQWLSDYDNKAKGNRYTTHHKYQHVLRNHPEPNKIRAIVNRAKQEDFQIIKEPSCA